MGRCGSGSGGKGKAFYTSFPDNTNAISARKLQCKILETVYNENGGQTDARTTLENEQKALLADPRLTDADRLEFTRIPISKE